MSKRILYSFAVAMAALMVSPNVFAQQGEEEASPPAMYRATARIHFNGQEGGVVLIQDGSEGNFQFIGGGEGGLTFGSAVRVMRNIDGSGDENVMVMQNVNNNGDESFMIQSNGETFAWNNQIADALNATPEQREEVRKVITEFRSQRPQPGQGPQGMTQRISELRTKIDQVIQPEQQTKLSELSFQLSGGLNSPSLNEQTLSLFDLSDKQKEQIRQIAEVRTTETMGQIRSRLTGGAASIDREALNAAAAERNQKHAEQIKAVLTKEQRARAEKLTEEAPDMREQMKMPQIGQPGAMPVLRNATQTQGGQTQPNRIQRQPYAPGSGSWQPGQGASNAPAPSENGSFPRRENN